MIINKEDGRTLKELFSKTLKNYNVADDTILKDLGFLAMKTRKTKHEFFLHDATGQHIDPGSPIS